MKQELKNTIISCVESCHGWCKEEKALVMAGLILATKPKVVVELGIFGGRSFIPQALALKEVGSGVIVGIDPWSYEGCVEGKNDKENDEWWLQQDLESIYKDFLNKLKKYEVTNHTSIVRDTATKVVNQIKEEISIAHFDANHSEFCSCRDLEEWMPKIKSGGFVILDDIDWATMQKAVRLIDKWCERIGGVSNSYIYIKR